MEPNEQVWTDERIIAEAEAIGAYFDSQEVGIETRKLCLQIRDEYEDAIAIRMMLIASLTAERDALLERVGWKPVTEQPLSLTILDEHGIGCNIYNNGSIITISTEAGGADIKLADNLRLCQRATVEQEAAVSDEVREAIRDALRQRKFDIYDACGADVDKAAQLCARYDKAFEWLDTLTGTGEEVTDDAS